MNNQGCWEDCQVYGTNKKIMRSRERSTDYAEKEMHIKEQVTTSLNITANHIFIICLRFCFCSKRQVKEKTERKKTNNKRDFKALLPKPEDRKNSPQG